ncbi:MAG: hypothetical protein HDS11_02735 [Bacteroides sp.]|nr:hypothetical protein [Bacteroides sp.]
MVNTIKLFINKGKTWYLEVIKPIVYTLKVASVVHILLTLYFGFTGNSNHLNIIFKCTNTINILVVNVISQFGTGGRTLFVTGITLLYYVGDRLPGKIRYSYGFYLFTKAYTYTALWLSLSYPLTYFKVQINSDNILYLRQIYLTHPDLSNPDVLVFYLIIALYAAILFGLVKFLIDKINYAVKSKKIKATIAKNKYPKFNSKDSVAK